MFANHEQSKNRSGGGGGEGEGGSRSYSSTPRWFLLPSKLQVYIQELECLIQDDGHFWLPTSASWKESFKEPTFWGGNTFICVLKPDIYKTTRCFEKCISTFPLKENSRLLFPALPAALLPEPSCAAQLWKAAWICQDNTFILQRPGQESACLGKAHRSALLNLWTPNPHHNLSWVLRCKTTSDQTRANKAGQWEGEGAEMGSGSSCKGLLGDAQPSLLQLQPQSQAGLRLGVIAPLTAQECPALAWTHSDLL